MIDTESDFEDRLRHAMTVLTPSEIDFDDERAAGVTSGRQPTNRVLDLAMATGPVRRSRRRRRVAVLASTAGVGVAAAAVAVLVVSSNSARPVPAGGSRTSSGASSALRAGTTSCGSRLQLTTSALRLTAWGRSMQRHATTAPATTNVYGTVLVTLHQNGPACTLRSGPDLSVRSVPAGIFDFKPSRPVQAPPSITIPAHGSASYQLEFRHVPLRGEPAQITVRTADGRLLTSTFRNRPADAGVIPYQLTFMTIDDGPRRNA